MPDNGFHEGLCLVGSHRQMYAGSFQLCQNRGNAVIGSRFVQTVPAVVVVEFRKKGFHFCGRCVRRQTAFAEFVHAVSHKVVVGIDRVRGQVPLFQQVVGGAAQIGDGVDKCAVQIKNGKLIHKTCSFGRNRMAVPVLVRAACVGCPCIHYNTCWGICQTQ